MSNQPATSPALCSNQAALVAVGVTILFWSSAFAGIRAALQGYSPVHLTLFRFAIASAVLGAYALFSRPPWPNGRDLPRLIFVGFSGITLYHLLLNIGQQTVPAAAASLLIATSPVFAAILSTFILGERLTRHRWAGMIISFSGVVIMVVGSGQSVGFTQGALSVLLAAVCSALFIVAQKPLLTKYKPIHLTAYYTWIGTIPLLFWGRGLLTAVIDAPATSTIAVIYIGLFPAALAYATWSIALAAMPASTTASFLYLNPPLATLIAFVWLGETPSLAQILGGAVALVGVVMVNRRRATAVAGVD